MNNFLNMCLLMEFIKDSWYCDNESVRLFLFS
jgi:hypothetical protein